MTDSIVPFASQVGDLIDRLPRESGLGRAFRRLRDESVAADWMGCELASVFQPIVDPASGAVIAHEAFLRCLAGGYRDLSPWLLFSATADDDRLIALDRLARTLHVLNFMSARSAGTLFLNVHGRLLATVAGDHGAAFRRILEALELPPERIVIETPVVASRQADLLSFVLRNYRHNGFRVAVNVESLAQWRVLAGVVSADFVKVDAAALVAEGESFDALARWGDSLGKAQLVVKRVETVAPVLAQVGALAQGLAYAPPQVLSGAVRVFARG